MTIESRGTTADGRPIVYWSDGSWSYVSEYGQFGTASGGLGVSDPNGVGPEYDPVVHFQGDPNAAKPGSDGKAYTLTADGQKRYVAPSLYGAPIPEGKNSFFSSGLQWNPTTGQYEQKGIDPGNLLALGIGGALGAEAIPAIVGGAGAATTAGTPTLEGIAAGPEAASIPVGSVPLGAIENAPFGLSATTASALPGAAAAPSAAADMLATYGTVPAATGAVAGDITDASQLAAGGGGVWGTLGKVFGTPGVIPSIISSGTGLIGAKMQADAASQAAALQNQYLNKALDIGTQEYNQRIANLQPYRSAGTQGLGQLNSLMGLPQVGQAPYAQPIPIPGQNTVSPTSQPLTRDPATNLPLYKPGQAVPSGAPNTSTGQPVLYNSSANLQTLGAPASPASSVGTLNVKAPNGNVYQVPPAQLSAALANGGQVING